DFEGGGERRAGGYPDGNALKLGDGACGLERRLVTDGDDLVDQLGFQDRWNKSRTDALDLVRTRLAAGEDWAVLGFDGDHLDRRLWCLQHLPDGGDGPAGADSGNDGVDLASGIGPDFLRRRLPMDFRIRRIL